MPRAPNSRWLQPPYLNEAKDNVKILADWADGIARPLLVDKQIYKVKVNKMLV